MKTYKHDKTIPWHKDDMVRWMGHYLTWHRSSDNEIVVHIPGANGARLPMRENNCDLCYGRRSFYTLPGAKAPANGFARHRAVP